MINQKTVQTGWPKSRKKALKNLKLLRWFRYQIYRRTLLMNPYGILLCNENRELDATPDKPINIKKASPSSIRYLKALCRCRYIVRGEKTLPTWFRPRKEQIILDSFCDLKFRDFPLQPVSMPHLRKIYKTVRNFYFQAKRAIKDLFSKVILYTKAVVHSLASPFYSRGFFLNSKMRDLLQYKNKHTGQRCFLIGNGPSLKTTDLELLENEITFSCNMITKIFDQTSWRPTYHCMIDALIAKYQCEELTSSLSCPFFTNYSTEKLMKSLPQDTVSVRNLGLKPYRVHGNMLAYYIPSGATVMSFMLELAMFMGFKEIYLLGVDCTSSLSSSGHFIQGYRDDAMKEKDRARICKRLNRPYMTDEEVGQYYFEQSMSTYHTINDYAQKHQISIFNATRGGALEVFPRVTLEDITKTPLQEGYTNEKKYHF